MEQTRIISAIEPPKTRAAGHFVIWLRELEECRAGNLVSEEDFACQRAEKLAELLHPPRFLWLASLLGASLVAAVGGGITWWFTHDWRLTGLGVALAGLWGLTSLGRVLRERFVDFQLKERMSILITLLDHDLVTATEFSGYEEQLAQGRTAVL